MQRWIIGYACLVGACSWTFAEKVTSPPTLDNWHECTTSSGFVVWDGMLVAAHAASAVLLANKNDEEVDNTAFVALNIVGGLVHTVSLIDGALSVDDCRKQKEIWKERAKLGYEP